MDKLTTQDVTEILVQVTKLICENSDKLCELDSVVGDGDHGTTIQRGVKAAQEKVEANAPEKIDALFSTFAMGMISSMGGASGPIFGSFFQGAALAAKGKTEVDAAAFIDILKSGQQKVQAIGKAAEGDKTLIDSLAPAIKAAEETHNAGGSLVEVIVALHKGAMAGVEDTKKMVAQKGRSRYAGERGLGHADAGATSMSLILQAFADHVKGAAHA